MKLWRVKFHAQLLRYRFLRWRAQRRVGAAHWIINEEWRRLARLREAQQERVGELATKLRNVQEILRAKQDYGCADQLRSILDILKNL